MADRLGPRATVSDTKACLTCARLCGCVDCSELRSAFGIKCHGA